MATVEEFLDVYRKLEAVYRESNLDYRIDVEEHANDMIQGRMRICRHMRNFLVHRSDHEFVEVSDKQVQFLKKLLEEERLKGDVLQDHMITPRTGSCFPNDTLDAVVRKMGRLHTQFLPVYDREGKSIGLISLVDVAMGLISNKTVAADIKPCRQAFTAVADTSMDDISKKGWDIVCCTEDGTAYSKLRGVYYKKEG